MTHTTPRTKGHWPKGRRRNADRGDWGIVLTSLTALLEHHHRPGVVSMGALATALGTYSRTVHKWVSGLYRPDPETQDRISTWVRQRQAEIERELERKRRSHDKVL